jgi:hypothetical protein
LVGGGEKDDEFAAFHMGSPYCAHYLCVIRLLFFVYGFIDCLVFANIMLRFLLVFNVSKVYIFITSVSCSSRVVITNRCGTYAYLNRLKFFMSSVMSDKCGRGNVNSVWSPVERQRASWCIKCCVEWSSEMKAYRLGWFRTRLLRHINIHGVLTPPQCSVRHSCNCLYISLH